MDVLSALGVNSTLFLQFFVFLIAYVFLNTLVFVPYHRAYEERKKRTEGNSDRAERILSESQQLEIEYEKKARELNKETKNIYDLERSEAMKIYDQTINQAREKNKLLIEENRLFIQQEVLKVRDDMKKEWPQVAEGVVKKLMNRENYQ